MQTEHLHLSWIKIQALFIRKECQNSIQVKIILALSFILSFFCPPVTLIMMTMISKVGKLTIVNN